MILNCAESHNWTRSFNEKNIYLGKPDHLPLSKLWIYCHYKQVREHSFSAYVNFFEKLTFLTPIKHIRCKFFWKLLTTKNFYRKKLHHRCLIWFYKHHCTTCSYLKMKAVEQSLRKLFYVYEPWIFAHWVFMCSNNDASMLPLTFTEAGVRRCFPKWMFLKIS